VTYQGREGAVAFFNDIMQTIRKRSGDVLIVASCESALPNPCENGGHGLDRLLSLNGATEIKCILTDASEPPLSTPRFEFRFISKHYVDPIPFFVYGDKYALMTQNGSAFPKFIVVQSPATAEASRRHFLSMWDKATPFYAAQKTEKPTGARHRA